MSELADSRRLSQSLLVPENIALFKVDGQIIRRELEPGSARLPLMGYG
jgi:hypothetical protein